MKSPTIMYECTYALRGLSGIPRDTRNLVPILDSFSALQIVVNLTPADQPGANLGIKSKIKELKSSLRGVYEGLFGQSDIEIERVEPEQDSVILIKNNIHWAGSLWKIKINYLGRFIRVIFRNPMTLNVSGFDFFIQQQIDPITIRGVSRHIVRLHDILPVTHPQFFKLRAVFFFRIALLRMVRNQEISWVMDTNASAEAFKAWCGPDLDVAVIPSLVEPEFINSKISFPKKKKVLMVNTIEPRKGVEMAIAAFCALQTSESIASEWQFVIAGNQGWKSKTLTKKLRSHHFGSSVIYKEGLSNEEILSLMAECAVIVSASAAEGFGLPPLEGTAMGCVAAVSNIPQHHETLGKFGYYFNPTDKIDCQKAIKLACEYALTLSQDDFTEMRNYVETRFGKMTIQSMWDSYFS